MPKYMIKSGKPAGEVYDWWVFVAGDQEGAQNCLDAMIDAIPNDHRRESWMWGPSIHEIQEGDKVLEWNGYEEVPAENWMGQKINT